MRILVLQGNYFGDLWRAAGHSVVVCSDAPDADLSPQGYFVELEEILAALGPSRQPDAIFLGDTSTRIRVLGLERSSLPKVLWSIDTHHHAAWQVPYAAVFDRVFVAQRAYLEPFLAAGRAAEWLPCYAPIPTGATPLGFSTAKRHDLCFVGSLDPSRHPARRRFLAALEQRLPIFVQEGPFAEVFAASRIVLNQAVKRDLNFRVFEALGCGSFLLTERAQSGLLELFEDGRHLVTYEPGDVGDAERVARLYLADEGARQRIAEAGFDEVCRRHLRSHRAAAVLDAFAEIAAAPRRAVAPTALEVDLARAYLHACASLVHNAATLWHGGRLTQRLGNVVALLDQHLLLARHHASRAAGLTAPTETVESLGRDLEAQALAVDGLRRLWLDRAEARA